MGAANPVAAQNLVSGTSQQRADAETQLAAIRDPAAVPALVRVLGGDIDTRRGLLVRLLDEFPAPEARDALVRLLLDEEEPTVRRVLADAIERRADPETTTQLLGLLRSPDPARAGRAALALADLRITDAVPQLVKLLVRVETKMVFVPSMNAGGPVVGFSSGRSFAELTGPAVAPGAVAYGAVGPNVNPVGGWNRNPPSVRLVTIVHNNPEVLSALITLTGQDFGYDANTWRRWVATAYRAQEQPARRVQQP